MDKTKKKKIILSATIVFVLSCLSLVASILILNRFNIDKAENQKDAVQLFVRKTNFKIRSGYLDLKDGVYEVEEFDLSEMMFKPDLGWIKVYKGKISEYALYFLDSDKDVGNKLEKGSYYINCCVQKIGDEVTCEELPSNIVVNVKDYGAKGNISFYFENLSDLIVESEPEGLNISYLEKACFIETKRIQKAVETVNQTGGVLYFPYGTYWVIVPDYDLSGSNKDKSIFTIETNKKVIVELGQSEIKQTSLPYPYNFPMVNIFHIAESEDVQIKNGTITGDRREHDYDNEWKTKSGSSAWPTHEWGYGVFFWNTKKGLAKNLKVKECTGDAIVVMNGQKSIDEGVDYITYIEDCEISYCRRQGITFGHSDKSFVKNCSIHHIGTSDIFLGSAKYGTNPMSGIDIEPRSGSYMVDLVDVVNTKIYDCSGFGIIADNKFGRAVDIKIEDSYIEYPNFVSATVKDSTILFDYWHKDPSKKGSAFRFCEFDNVKFKIDNPDLYAFNLTFNDCVIYNSNFESGFSFEKESESDQEYGNVRIHFYNNKVLNNVSFVNIKGFPGVVNGSIYMRYGLHFWGRGVSTEPTSKLYQVVIQDCCIHFIDVSVDKGDFKNCDIYIKRDSKTIEGAIVDLNNSTFRNCTCEISLNKYTNETKEPKVNLTNSNFYGCYGKISAGQLIINYIKCKYEGCTGNLFDIDDGTYNSTVTAFKSYGYKKRNSFKRLNKII